MAIKKFKAEDYNMVFDTDTGNMMRWGSYYRIPKGKFEIRSTSDNSIPYELFDLIESTFDCDRLHLG